MKPATLYFNGKVLTVDARDRAAEAFVVQGERFAAVGSNRELLSGFPAAERVDLRGRCVIPGLNDGHCHPQMAGLGELQGEIPVLSSLDDILGWIRAEAKKRPAGEWIYIHRSFPSRIRENRWPTREELDRAAPDHPVFLNGAWAGIINTRALGLSGIGLNHPNPGVVRDSSGRPNGVVHQSAYSLIPFKTVISEHHTDSERRQSLLSTHARYNRFGITSVTDTLRFNDDWDRLSGLAEDDALTVRVHYNCWLPGARDRKSADAIMDRLPFKTGTGDEWLRMGPFKAAVDGGLFTCTAYLNEPWEKPERDTYGSGRDDYRGDCVFTLEALAEVVESAVDHGFTFTAHCTGDGASLLLLQAYERVNQRKPVAGRGFQLLHGNFFTPPVTDLARKLGVILDLQGAWFYRDLDAILAMLGPGRMAHFHPYRTLWDQGLVLCGGSDHMIKNDPDWAVNPYNPFIGLYAMTERTTDRGTRFAPEQALTRMEALRAYTVNNARKSGEDAKKGSIEPGKLADFAILDRDFLGCGGKELRETKVLRTVVGGVTVFQAPVAGS